MHPEPSKYASHHEKGTNLRLTKSLHPKFSASHQKHCNSIISNNTNSIYYGAGINIICNNIFNIPAKTLIFLSQRKKNQPLQGIN